MLRVRPVAYLVGCFAAHRTVAPVFLLLPVISNILQRNKKMKNTTSPRHFAPISPIQKLSVNLDFDTMRSLLNETFCTLQKSDEFQHENTPQRQLSTIQLHAALLETLMQSEAQSIVAMC